MKQPFYFNAYEQKLLARYYDKIKLNYTCKCNWFKLSTAERNKITTYRAYWQHPEKYASSNPGMFIPQELLVLNSDLTKIREFFEYEPTVDCTSQKSESMWTEVFRKHLFNRLRNAAFYEHEFIWIAKLIQEMNNTGDGNTSFSAGNIGINITRNTIDIVDIEVNKSIATIRLEVHDD